MADDTADETADDTAAVPPGRTSSDQRRVRVTADIVASVVRLDVAVDDPVESGQGLLVIESMKMEITVAAPAAGTVTAIGVAVGDVVQEGDLLVELQAPPRGAGDP
jgi:acetyl-CoA carboxylase biotin carboxyl carrier protein